MTERCEFCEFSEKNLTSITEPLMCENI